PVARDRVSCASQREGIDLVAADGRQRGHGEVARGCHVVGFGDHDVALSARESLPGLGVVSVSSVVLDVDRSGGGSIVIVLEDASSAVANDDVVLNRNLLV